MAWPDEIENWGIEIVTAPKMNEQVRDALNYLYDSWDAAMYIAIVDVNYDDSSPKTIVSLPAYSVVTEVLVYVETAFNGSGGSIKLGDSDDDDGFMTAAQIGVDATGWKGEAEDDRGAYLWDGSNKMVKGYAGTKNVIATIVQGTATQGKVKVFVIYGK